MDINLPVLVGVAILVAILIIYLIRRNRKDMKKFEQQIIQSELPPEKDDKENV
ncbi:hypothetical protein [Pedobacter aquatilis]|uniref:hypothetical protein n=1 Tax=Pedobacter aquatilis TaxID=351343 RepID=UPI0029316D8A|nr:hypothetical protein [Pedobacter aquatilis]